MTRRGAGRGRRCGTACTRLYELGGVVPVRGQRRDWFAGDQFARNDASTSHQEARDGEWWTCAQWAAEAGLRHTD
jgi:hypothetical protein